MGDAGPPGGPARYPAKTLNHTGSKDLTRKVSMYKNTIKTIMLGLTVYLPLSGNATGTAGIDHGFQVEFFAEG